ncbi:MAG: S-layer homology domain-containing protein [Oscillospiraceae bacterium]|nr:S-layer homology domain-containing protein [Oscillospiraceae bacterium]
MTKLLHIYNRLPLTGAFCVVLLLLLFCGFTAAAIEEAPDTAAEDLVTVAAEIPEALAEPTSDGYTLIYDAAGLKAIALGLTKNYRLAADIDLSLEANWQPIAGSEKFTGTLEGAGYTIYGLNVSRDSERFAGLFGRVGPGGRILNLNVSDAKILGAYNVGTLVGYLEGELNNCNVFGLYTNVAGTDGALYVGGLAGYAGESAKILNSSFSGSVSASDNGVVGGIVGYVYSAAVSGCAANDAEIYGGVQSFAGGLAGFLNVSSIDTSYAASAVLTGANSRTGGLIGGVSAGSTVFDSYALGSVTAGAESSVGGLVGQNAGEIAAVYSVVPTYADDFESAKIGSLVGNNVGNISGAYIINSGSSLPVVGSGTGEAVKLNFEQATRQVNYSAFNFGNIWNIEEYSTLPVLRGISQIYAPDGLSATVTLGVGVSSKVQLNSLKTRLNAYERPEIDRVELKPDLQTFMTSAPQAYSGVGIYRLWYPAYNNRGALYIYQIEVSVVNPEKLILVADCAEGLRGGTYLGEVKFTPANVQLNYKLNGVDGSSTSLNISGDYTELNAQVLDDFGGFAQKKLNDMSVQLSGETDFDYAAQVVEAFGEAEYTGSFDRVTAALDLYSELSADDRETVLRIAAAEYYELLADRLAVERLQRELRAAPSLDSLSIVQFSSKYNALGKNAKLYFDSTSEGQALRDGIDYVGTSAETSGGFSLLRSEFFQLLYESKGSPAVYVLDAGPFTDIGPDTPYYDAIIWGNAGGLANGVGDGRFIPGGDFSYEQAATVLALYSGDAIDLTAAGSLAAVQCSEWAVPYVNWAISHGMFSAENFQGSAPLSYATAASLLSRS